jgi:hypothetical protein
MCSGQRLLDVACAITGLALASSLVLSVTALIGLEDVGRGAKPFERIVCGTSDRARSRRAGGEVERPCCA